MPLASLRPTPRHLTRLPHLLTLAAMLGLGACGGGGDSTTGTSSTTGSSTAASAKLSVQLSGVAAYGAPFSGAQVRALDSTGKILASTTANNADGSYSLSVDAAAGPLLLQAVGTDAQGTPLVLHSALPKAEAGATLLHITPLTDAAVAVAMGTEPRQAFAAAVAAGNTTASTISGAWGGLANLAAAGTFVAGLVKPNLTDAKAGDAAKIDLFSDASFRANKTGQDLALETLSLGYGLDSKGAAQLQLANKLGSAAVEVAVGLATAASELARTGGTVANAITSTLKTTTSTAALSTNLGKLDDLVATLNGVLAAASTGTSVEDGLSTAGLVAAYERHDGADLSALKERLGVFATSKMQIGRLQVTGCMDETIDKTGCKRVAVAARLSDASGSLVGSLGNAVVYDSKATPKARWNLVGNGQAAAAQARSVAWRALNPEGSDAAGTSVRLGVQLVVGAQATSASVQTPSGYVLPMASCSRSTLCFGLAADSSVATLAKGALAEDTLFAGASAWLGSADTASAARYTATLVTDAGTTSRATVLRGVFPSAPAGTRFATLDGIGSGQPLRISDLLQPLTLNWAQWAAAHPDMRLVSIRTVHTNADGETRLAEQTLADWVATTVSLSPADVDGFSIDTSTVWLAAVDSAGRWYYTSIAAR